MEQVTALPVVKVNVDDNSTMTTAYSVYSVPTVIVVAEDGTEHGRFSGARDAEFVNRFIASHS
jgi:thioredoxin-like negative regulator of GroEL